MLNNVEYVKEKYLDKNKIKELFKNHKGTIKVNWNCECTCEGYSNHEKCKTCGCGSKNITL